MATEWEPLLLGQLYEFSSGLSKPRSEFGSGYPFLSFKDVFYNFFVPEVLTERVKSTERERRLCSIRRGDVFLTRTSETFDELGMSCIALQDYSDATFNGFTKRLRPKSDRILPEFAGYLFRGPEFRKGVTAMSSLSTRASLNNEMLSRLMVRVPPKKEQAAIAAILKSIDDKVGLNRLMNETLEELTRAIFKSWFIDFEPVRAKMEGRQPYGKSTETADLFPNSLLESEHGPIPKSWSVGVLGEVADNFRRQVTPSQLEVPMTYIGLEHMPRRSIALGDWATSEGLGSNKFGFERGEILFGKLRPYFHKVGVAPVDGVCSTDILVIAPRTPEWHSFVLGHVSSDELVAHANSTSTGTRMPRTNWKDLSSYRIAIPPVDVASAFNELASPIVEAIIGNIHEARNLAAIRDTLLPKLISGEVRISDAEQMAEATL